MKCGEGKRWKERESGGGRSDGRMRERWEKGKRLEEGETVGGEGKREEGGSGGRSR